MGSMQIAPYDGCAEFHAHSAEHFVRFIKGVYDSAHLVGKGRESVSFSTIMHGASRPIY